MPSPNKLIRQPNPQTLCVYFRTSDIGFFFLFWD